MARTTRAEAPDELKYDPSLLYPDVDAWKNDIAALTEDLDTLKGYEERATESGRTLFALLQAVESMGNRLDRIAQYAHTHYMADASDTHAQALHAQAQSLEQMYQTAIAFVEPAIAGLSWSTFQQCRDDEPDLGRYEGYIERVMKGREHRLSGPVERVLAALQTTFGAPEELYGLLTNADLRCPPIMRPDGSEEEVAIDTFLFKLWCDPQREVRSAAYESLTKSMEAYEQTLTANYLNHVRTQVALAKLRGYPSAAHMFLAPEGIPVEFYHTALDVIMEEGQAIARRYIALQKRVQGLDKLRWYDVIAPLSTGAIALSRADGRELILTALKPLGEEYQDSLRAAFDERRIDLADNHGKFPIPVTLTSHGAPTYILSTWYDLLSDAMVLGHELGHLVHTDFSRTRNRFDEDCGMLRAETASTTNEWLMFHHLRRSGEAQNVLAAARYLLEFDFVQLVGTLFLIEKMQAEVYRRVEAGHPVSAADMKRLMAEYVQAFFGDDLEVTEADGLLWTHWPQPMYPVLYPYCYAAALCMSGTIAEAILDEGQPAVDRYLSFLRAGGDRPAPETYALTGIDMLNEDVLRTGIRRFGAVLTELEARL